MATIDELVAQLIAAHRETADRLENLRNEYHRRKDAEMLEKTKASIGSVLHNENETDLAAQMSATMRGKASSETKTKKLTQSQRKAPDPAKKRREPPAAEVSTKDPSQRNAKVTNRGPSVDSSKKETTPEKAPAAARPPSARRNPVQTVPCNNRATSVQRTKR